MGGKYNNININEISPEATTPEDAGAGFSTTLPLKIGRGTAKAPPSHAITPRGCRTLQLLCAQTHSPCQRTTPWRALAVVHRPLLCACHHTAGSFPIGWQLRRGSLPQTESAEDSSGPLNRAGATAGLHHEECPHLLRPQLPQATPDPLLRPGGGAGRRATPWHREAAGAGWRDAAQHGTAASTGVGGIPRTPPHPTGSSAQASTAVYQKPGRGGAPPHCDEDGGGSPPTRRPYGTRHIPELVRDGRGGGGWTDSIERGAPPSSVPGVRVAASSFRRSRRCALTKRRHSAASPNHSSPRPHRPQGGFWVCLCFHRGE